MRVAEIPTPAESLQAGKRRNRIARWLENRFLPGAAERRGRNRLLFERSNAALDADFAEYLNQFPVVAGHIIWPSKAVSFSDWRKQTPTIPQR